MTFFPWEGKKKKTFILDNFHPGPCLPAPCSHISEGYLSRASGCLHSWPTGVPWANIQGRYSARGLVLGRQIQKTQAPAPKRNLGSRRRMHIREASFKETLREFTLPTKVHLVKAMAFPVVTYGSESCTIKKAKHRRIDAFELRCWRRLLRDPWTARRFNQSILKEISPEYLLEGLILKLKIQYFGHLMWWTDWFENTQMLGKIEGGRRRGRRGWDGWMASVTQWTSVWVNSGSWYGQGSLVCCSPWGGKQSDTIEWLDWTELKG